MDKLKIVFCGTPKIAAKILQTLLTMNEVEIKLVISQPDKPIGRKKLLTPTPVKQLAIDSKLELIQPEKVTEVYEILKGLDYDILLTCAYGQFIPQKILDLAKIDNLNVHGSLLPKYRGGAPIQYALKNDEKYTGISLMKMIKKMDAGPYYVQKKLKISEDDDTGSLFEKLAILGSELIKDNLLDIANKKIKPVNQDESKVSFSKNIASSEEEIDWNQQSRAIFNFVRSLSPEPIAYTTINNQRYKIKKVTVCDYFKNKLSTPGQIVEFNKTGIIVATKTGYIQILEIQRPGKKMQPANLYFLNNLKDLQIGDLFLITKPRE